MVTPTVRLYGMVSTKAGMRRILKKPLSTVDYIRKAVDTGVYRTSEELTACAEERRESADLLSLMRRFRQDVVRGSNIHDYPLEYTILRENPPIPDPPHVPKNLARKLRHREMEQGKRSPIESLVRKYMNRFEQKEKDRTGSKHSKVTMSSEAFYERLLGVQASRSRRRSESTLLEHRSADVQQAYNAAIHHYQLQRTNGEMTDAECMKQVDEILKSQLDEELKASQQARDKATGRNDAAEKETSGEKKKSAVSTVVRNGPKLVQDDAAVIKGMMIWSDRLQAVPYNEWTVGASTLLDHWIARHILKLSEETWQLCLEGSYSSPHYLAIGRNIVATREALFPETASDVVEDEEESEFSPEDNEEPFKPREKTIEELLASLGASKEQPIDIDVEASIERLVAELQEWRRKVHSTEPKQPYETWSYETKNEFDAWMKEYVDIVLLAGSHASSKSIDFDSTREAILSQPPVDKDESDAFWGSLSEPELAAELLNRLRSGDELLATVPLPAGVLSASTVWDQLDDDQKIERLLNLGALRPLLDEYTKESDRVNFLRRYGYLLLQDVKLEHLVSDPRGPITAADLPESIKSDLNIRSNDRFKLQMKPYNAMVGGNDGKGDNDIFLTGDEKSRLLFMAWNTQKAGRARYEERMFQTGRLGLRYGDELSNGVDEDSDED